MAEMVRSRAAAGVRREELPVAWLQRVTGGIFDWETLITLGLLLVAVTAVSVPLEDGGWRDDMPALTTVSVVAVLSGALLARSKMSAMLAWPLSILAGAGVVFWQALVMVGPGTLSQRLDTIYYRFDAWLSVVSSNQVTNDPLPFNVLILSLTWLGVILFTWSVYRWHNAWIGLIPGGVALFLDLTLVGDDLTGAIVLYMLFGFLLVMQTNLLAMISRWRADNAAYPSMINLTFLNFSFWALVAMMFAAWITPAGLTTPGPIQSAVEDAVEFGAKFVRLAGPLQSNKVVPIHSYSGVLPFQGSIKLGDRELMSVTVTEPGIHGTLLLRGSVYDSYEGGGWRTTPRREISLPEGTRGDLEDALLNDPELGTLIPLQIRMEARSVVGTVVFTPGLPVESSQALTVQVPEDSIENRAFDVPVDGAGMSDAEVLEYIAPELAEDEMAIGVVRAVGGLVRYVEIVDLNAQGLVVNSVILDPGERIKRNRSYFVTGFIPNVTPADLRAAGSEYPAWVTKTYLGVPESVPPRVGGLAAEWQAGADNPYDTAKAIEEQLRKRYSVNPDAVGETPINRDTVDYFLFDNPCTCGYFDYHASAMVVMLRTLGIPARLAVGFAVDDTDRDLVTLAYEVRDRNSYSWPEVYFPEYGWIAFNPSPDRSEDLLPTVEDDPQQSGLENIFENLPAGISDFNPGDEGSDIDFVNPPGGPAGSSSPLGGGEAMSPLTALGVIAFVAALVGAMVMGWQRSVAGMPYPQQVWEKTVRLASWGGMPPEPGQTPHDFADRLRKRFRGVRDFPALADAYTKSRFGRKDVGGEEVGELREAWPDIRGALIGGIARRVFRRNRRERSG